MCADRRKPIDVIALLGLPVTSAAAKAFLAANQIEIDYDDTFLDDLLTPGNEAFGAHLEISLASDYNAEYAKPARTKRLTDYVITEISLHSKGTNTKRTRTYPGALPFGLVFGDTGDVVTSKIGKKPSRTPGTSYAHAWWYRIGDHKLLAALDERTRLLWIRVVPLGRDEAAALERKRARPRSPARGSANARTRTK